MTTLYIIGAALALLGAGLSFFGRDRLTWSVALAGAAVSGVASAVGGYLWATLSCVALGAMGACGLVGAIRQARRAE
jgi:hypothetical protein